ncbi:MAG TPA: LCP family protein [Nocardioidaceae bacterium]|jgi:LCP family protein required for cell wall assembly|nr:LCP family protein [Nocardioidaceae bacterium]
MPPVTSPGSDDRLARVRFRRAVALLVMTLFLPGTAQLVAGRKQVGRVALRVWLGLLALVGLTVVVGVLWPGVLFWLFSNTAVLAVVRAVLLALAVGWAVLFLDAWRIGQPLELRQKQRLAVVGLNGALCFSVAGTLLFGAHVVGVQRDFIATMFGDGQASDAHDGRYNVLLLGGDSGSDRWGLRADSINVASIDADTGRTILFGLPRNMTDFPFAPGSLMDRQWPQGYDCDECELNSLATYAADHPDLFQGVDNPGVEATMQAVEGITGLKVNYYAMVNLMGFRNLVDAVGGITLNVRDRIPIGGVGGPVTGYIEPGVQHLDGFNALWFARSRETADDYSRMARQKCVLNAMLAQLSPQTVITKFEKIAKASEDVVTTDLPASELGTFAQLALKARTQPVRTVSFVPPMINTGDPDIALIQSTVTKAIARSEAAGDGAGDSGADTAADGESQSGDKRKGGKAHKAFTRSEAPTTGGSIGSLSEGYAANQAENLSSAC